MNCPDCNGYDVRVIDTLKSDAINTRRLACQRCGVRWQTDETIRKGSIQRRVTPIRTPSLAIRPPPLASGTPSVASDGDGGVGGGLSSGSDLSLFPGSDLLSDRSSNPDQTRARKKRRDAEYTSPQFVAFWEVYPKKVSKRDAATAWWKLGLDAHADAVIAGLRVQLAEFARRDRDKVPNAATWLNGERWRDDPAAYSQMPRVAVPRCPWHAKNGRGPSRYPTVACPDCKEHAARTAGRTSEPTPLSDALPDWAQVRETVKPPTAEELRELRGVAK